jgi:hypothetical protein
MRLRRWQLVWSKANGKRTPGARFFFRRNAERHARALFYEMGFHVPPIDDMPTRPRNVEVEHV